jgi:hypothetical protein
MGLAVGAAGAAAAGAGVLAGGDVDWAAAPPAKANPAQAVPTHSNVFNLFINDPLVICAATKAPALRRGGWNVPSALKPYRRSALEPPTAQPGGPATLRRAGAEVVQRGN